MAAGQADRGGGASSGEEERGVEGEVWRRLRRCSPESGLRRSPGPQGWIGALPRSRGRPRDATYPNTNPYTDGGRAEEGVAALKDEEADVLANAGLSAVFAPGGRLLRACEIRRWPTHWRGSQTQVGSPPWPGASTSRACTASPPSASPASGVVPLRPPATSSPSGALSPTASPPPARPVCSASTRPRTSASTRPCISASLELSFLFLHQMTRFRLHPRDLLHDMVAAHACNGAVVARNSSVLTSTFSIEMFKKGNVPAISYTPLNYNGEFHFLYRTPGTVHEYWQLFLSACTMNE